MELRTYLSIINRRKKLIAIVFSVLFLLVVVVTLLIPPRYSSTARLRVLTPIGGGTNYLNFDIYYATRLMNTYASMASSSAVVDEVKKKFNLTDTPDITATVIADSELIRITVLEHDPVMSASIANSIADILLANKNSSAMQAQTASDSVINAQLDEVNRKLVEARARYKEIFIPYTENNSKIALLNTELQNDRNLYVSIKDRIETGRQTTSVSQAVLAAQEAQLADIQIRIDQRTAELDAMNTKAAEDTNLIDSTQREISLIEGQYSNIVLQRDQMKSLQALQYSSESLMVVDQAVPSVSPASPNYLLVFILGFFISIFLAVILAITLDNLDEAYTSPNQISTFTRTPYWGEAGTKGKPAVTHSASIQNEDTLPNKSNELRIENFPAVQSLQSVVISGVDNDSAFSQVWVKMALEFSQKGRKTVLVDGNLNNPSLHTQFLSTVNDQGLREVLDGKISLEAALKETGRQNLTIMTAGLSEGSAKKMIHPVRMAAIIEDLKTQFSMIVIGIPSVTSLHGNDEFITNTDGVVLVVEQGNSRKKSIRENIDRIENLNAQFLGYIVANEEKAADTSPFPEKAANRKISPEMDQL